MKPSLVVLAAGMGSRYGSLKQLEQIGPSGETILDYSVYDAIKAGFDKVVFIIRRSIEAEFKEVFGNRFGDRIEVEFVHQEIDLVPNGFVPPADRVKPWGTGHAVLMAANKINSPFAVINADDFYGQESYKILFDYLDRIDPNKLNACLIGYRLDKTLSKHGTVSRGVCKTDKTGNLISITERTAISLDNNNIINFKLDGKNNPIDGSSMVSMNLLGFSAKFFKVLKEGFDNFLKTSEDPLKGEYFLPTAIDTVVKRYGVNVPVIPTPETTMGVTYKEDKPVVQEYIQSQIDAGKYPKSLWG